MGPTQIPVRRLDCCKILQLFHFLDTENASKSNRKTLLTVRETRTGQGFVGILCGSKLP